jgi:ABC-type sugar transport system substrate-binding protein
MLLSAWQPAVPTNQATEKPESTEEPTREAAVLICIIVPEVEKPYYNSLLDAVSQKAEKLCYATLKMAHNWDSDREVELIDHCSRY